MGQDTLYAAIAGRIVCIRKTDGTEVWRTKLPKLFHNLTTILVEENAILAASQKDLFALNSSTGSIEWQESLNIRGSVCILASNSEATNDENFYAAMAGRILCVRKRDGQEVWRTTLPKMFQDITTILVENDAILAASHKDLFALNSSTGSIQWQEPHKVRGSVCILASNSEMTHAENFYAAIAGRILCVRKRDGQEVWRTTLPKLFQDITTILVEKDVILAASKGDLFALDPSTGSIQWQERLKISGSVCILASNSELLGDKVFYAAIAGRVVCLRKRDGSELWRTKLPKLFQDITTILVEKDVILAASKGDLFALDPSTGSMKWETPLKAKGSVCVLASDSQTAAAAAAQVAQAMQAVQAAVAASAATTVAASST